MLLLILAHSLVALNLLLISLYHAILAFFPINHVNSHSLTNASCFLASPFLLVSVLLHLSLSLTLNFVS